MGAERVRTNYVFIDYENVQPDAAELLKLGQFRVLIFVGANQKRITVETARAVQKLAAGAEYVQLPGAGRNALDFVIAYHVGRLAAADPEGFFHVISKDTGFDPLIAHLKENKIFAGRWASVTDIPLVKLSSCRTTPERTAAVVEHLRTRQRTRPGTLKTLTSTIQALFLKTLSETDVTAIIRCLQKDGLLDIKDQRVVYRLPERA